MDQAAPPPQGPQGVGLFPGLEPATFRVLFDHHAAIMMLSDAQTLELVEANQAALDFYGYSRQEFLRKRLPDLNLVSEEVLRAELAQAQAQGRTTYHFQHRLKDGQVRDMEINSTPIALAGGRRVHFAVLHDVSHRRRQEEALRTSEQSLRLLLDNAREIVAVVQDGLITFINQSCQRVSGYAPEELMGKPFWHLIVSEDLDRVRCIHEARMRGEEVPEAYECRILHKDGSTRWLEVSGVVAQWRDSLAAISFMSDITHRKQIEDARVLKEKLRAAIETAGAACHEMNQPLQGLLSQLELLLLRLPEDQPLRPGLEAALATAHQLRDITQRLNRLTDYRTRQYLEGSRILDLEGSSRPQDPGPEA